MWILIMATLQIDADGAPTRNAEALATAEFSDRRACEKAARELRISVPNLELWCLPKES